jgi:hypothetical protein
MHQPSRYENIFTPLEREQELLILLNDDDSFTNTKHYLDALILQALSHFKFTREQHDTLHHQLVNDVPLAASRFLNNERNIDADFKFCTYFTWYISERINKIEGLQRRFDN